MKVQGIKQLKNDLFAIRIKISKTEFIDLYKSDLFLKALVDRHGVKVMEKKVGLDRLTELMKNDAKAVLK